MSPIGRAAIFISVFFHAAVLGTLVFSFAVSPGLSKPFFVFLGSILPKQDFVFPKGKDVHIGSRIQLSPQILMVSPHTSSYPASISKPSFQNNISNRGKTVFKRRAFSAADQPEDQGNPEMMKKNLGIESKIPAYTPLKLYTK